MMLDGDHQRAWKDGEKRESRIVFIGRNLPEEKIRKGFESCVRLNDASADEHDTARPHIPSVDRVASHSPSRRAGRSSRCISSAAARCSCSARRRCCSWRRTAPSSASRRMRAASSRRPATARASSPAATTARSWRRTPRARRETVATDAKASLDRSASRSGRMARSRGRPASRRSCATPRARSKSLDLPSSAGGARVLAEGLSPRDRALQRRDAVVSERAGEARNARLEGLASRRDVRPDGRFLVTSMQEPMLHGWRLADGKDMRMSGYSAKVRSLCLDGGRQMARDRRAPSSSSCGRSAPRTARWASSRACSRPTTSAPSRSPVTRSRRSSRSALRTAW